MTHDMPATGAEAAAFELGGVRLSEKLRTAEACEHMRMLNHALRQPLTAMLATVEAARLGAAPDAPSISVQRSVIDDLALQAHRAADLLSAAVQRFEAAMGGAPPRRVADVNDVVAAVVAGCRERVAPSVAIELQLEARRLVADADPVRLALAVEQLLRAAARGDGRDGAAAAINVRTTSDVEDAAVIEVTVHGRIDPPAGAGDAAGPADDRLAMAKRLAATSGWTLDDQRTDDATVLRLSVRGPAGRAP